ncbi:coatomer epsilon subunit-domain-containing protein [Pyronema omphalodes]|nr:coatomer epsilon subunit-domain-containing protein [Pyronema omphalodes]
MDPFSAEGELLTLHNAFHQGIYSTVINFPISSLSASNQTTARILQLRARILSGEAAAVLNEFELASSDVEGSVELQAVKAFAQYVTGETEEAVAKVEALIKESKDNETVQVLGGMVLVREGRLEEAVEVLKGHQGSLEALSLMVYIRLSQNRTDLAIKEVTAAKKWAQDSMLVNLAESWVGLRQGAEKYQQSFYVYEELAQAPISSSAQTLTGQAIAELHLGRLEEAEVALKMALEKDPNFPEALVALVVHNVLAGKETEEVMSTLQTVAPNHIFLQDLKAKSDLFDQAAAKYSPKIAA